MASQNSEKEVLDGFHFPNYMTADSIKPIQEVKYKNNDCLILSYQKTGSTWLSEITWLVLHNADTEAATKTHLDQRVLFLDMPAGPKKIAEQQEPCIIKSHLPAQFLAENVTGQNYKALVIDRNVKDTLVSYFNFLKNKKIKPFEGSWDDFFVMFQKKELHYGDFGAFYRSWSKYASNPNFLFLNYESMKSNPFEEIKKIACHLNVDITDDQLSRIVEHTSFDKMKTNPAVVKNPKFLSNFFRKGKVGDWVNYFSEEQLCFMEGYEKSLNG